LKLDLPWDQVTQHIMSVLIKRVKFCNLFLFQMHNRSVKVYFQ
jgi:hypothetical protein